MLVIVVIIRGEIIVRGGLVGRRVERSGRGSRCACQGAVGRRGVGTVVGLTVELELIRVGGIVERRGRLAVQRRRRRVHWRRGGERKRRRQRRGHRRGRHRGRGVAVAGHIGEAVLRVLSEE